MKLSFFINIKYILLSIFCLVAISSGGQNVSQAEDLFNVGNYEEAYKIYAKIAETNTSGLARYRVARCLIEMKCYDEAIPLLEYAAGKKVKRAYLSLYDAYYQTYQFDKALSAIDTYISLFDDSEVDSDSLQGKKQKAIQAQNMFDRIEKISVIDSVKVAKTHFFEVYNLSDEMGKLKITSSENDSLQTVMFNTGRGDKKIFSKFSPQNSADIYVSYRLIDGWSEEKIISSVVNSANFNENYPFEMADGVTLYFSSDNDESLGGYDIFMSRYNSENQEYTRPLNIGMPFNSPANDYMLVLDEMKNRGWFASDRYQSPDSVVIYEFVPNEERTLLEEDDWKIRRDFATLKNFKPEVFAETEVSTQQEKSQYPQHDEICFLLNDGVVYTDIDDFESEDAKILFVKAEELKCETEELKLLLTDKRKDFSSVTEHEKKDDLRIEIISLEAAILQLTKQYNQYILEVRKFELEY